MKDQQASNHTVSMKCVKSTIITVIITKQDSKKKLEQQRKKIKKSTKPSQQQEHIRRIVRSLQRERQKQIALFCLQMPAGMLYEVMNAYVNILSLTNSE